MIGPTGAVRVMTGAVRVMVATKPVDFRKGAEGMAALLRETMAARIRSPLRNGGSAPANRTEVGRRSGFLQRS